MIYRDRILEVVRKYSDQVAMICQEGEFSFQDLHATSNALIAYFSGLGLGKGDKVELRGFGSFRIRHRNSRKGRNPKTGDSVSVPEKRVPFFKVGKRLRELVNT